MPVVLEGSGTRRERRGPRACWATTVALALTLSLAPAALAAVSRPLRSVNPAGLRAGKAAAHREALRSGTLGAQPRATGPRTAVFGGLNLVGLNDTSGSPPDATGAIGSDHYVEIINSQIGVFDRGSLALLAQASLPTFVGSSAGVCDPQIQWDPQGQRWFYVALNCDLSPSPNQLFLGWSRSANPTDLTSAGWCRFTRNTGSLLYDYPKLGHDDSHLLVGANGFDVDTFITAVILAVPKPAPGATSCPASLPSPTVFGSSGSPLRTPDGDLASTPVPANTSDASTTGYVVAADDPTVPPLTRNQLTVWRVGGTATSPTLDAGRTVLVSNYTIPDNVPEPGPDGLTLDSLDGRLTQAVAHADPSAQGAEAIWTQHTVNGPQGRSVVRWYELLGADASLRQEGTVSPAGLYAFNGAISPTAGGSSAVINFNTGSASALVQLRAQSRNAGTPLGAMGGEVLLGQSQDIDADFSCTPPAPCRWGDYAGASPDPVQSNVVWGSSQLNGPAPSSPGDPSWITRNFAVQASVPPAAIFSVDTAGPVSGQQISFTSSSADPDSPIAAQAWDFDGDGSFSDAAGPVAIHAFPRPGAYPVSLRVIDSEGAVSVASRTVTVGDRPPAAAITASRNPVVRRPVAFDASGSADLDGSVVRYQWDLDGNGSFETDTGRTARARHTYTRAVRVAPRVRVTDNAGNAGQASVALRILSRRPALRIVRARLRSVLAHGLRVRLRSPLGGRARVTLTLDSRTAQRLGVLAQSTPGIVVGSTRARVRAGRTRSVRVRLRRAARRRLRRVRSIRLTVRVSIPQRRAQSVVATRSVRLRR